MTSNNDLAFFILDNERDEHGEFWALIAERGKPGYARTDWHWGDDKELAQKLCNERNEVFGLSEEDVAVLIASTLSRRKGIYVEIEWGEEQTREENNNGFSTYHFETKAELEAFMLGVDEASGWMNYFVAKLSDGEEVQEFRE